MISIEELNPHNYPTNELISKNLKILFERLMELQDACEMAFKITSGLRSDEHQIQLIAEGKSNALHSKHCAGLSADVYDPEGVLKEWCLLNEKVLENIGLWCEDFRFTPNWCHFQCSPPKSGKRFFIP